MMMATMATTVMMMMTHVVRVVGLLVQDFRGPVYRTPGPRDGRATRRTCQTTMSDFHMLARCESCWACKASAFSFVSALV